MGWPTALQWCQYGVSTTYWPGAWPSPEPGELTVLTGDCAL